jgi:hypothetical protein
MQLKHSGEKEMGMKKRKFVAGGVGIVGAAVLGGCVSRISESARDKENG